MKNPFVLLLMLALYSCTQTAGADQAATVPASTTAKDTVACQPGNSKLDTALITQVTGMKGIEKKPRISLLRGDAEPSISSESNEILPV